MDVTGFSKMAIKPVLWVLGKIFGYVKILRATRKAGEQASSPDNDYLLAILEKTYARLIKDSETSIWRRDLKHEIEYKVSAPKLLKESKVQVWLSVYEVKEGLIELARCKILNIESREVITALKRRLIRSFGESVGDSDYKASRVIVSVRNALVATYKAELHKSHQPLAAMIQSSASRVIEDSREMQEKLDAIVPNDVIAQSHTSKIESDLRRILISRNVHLESATNKLRILSDQVIHSAYKYAAPITRLKVLDWAGRLHALNRERLPDAKRYILQIREIDSGYDTSVIQAYILETEEKVDDAVKVLRDIVNDEAHSALFTIIARSISRAEAIEWYEGSAENDNENFFTPSGWANLINVKAQESHWNDAVRLVKRTASLQSEWPDLAYIGGIVNAAMLLPEELRQNALGMNIFHTGIHTATTKESERYRKDAQALFEKAAELHEVSGVKERALAARDWVLWLRLTDHNNDVSTQARDELKELMENAQRAVQLLPLAKLFGVEFDASVVTKHLRQRKRLGGLDGGEVIAELLLSEITMEPAEYCKYLESEEDKLRDIIPEGALSVIRIDAYMDVGHIALAKKLLEDKKSSLPQYDYERLNTMILARSGDDPRVKLESLYNKTNSLIDLQNLVMHLSNIRDYDAVSPLLKRLYEIESTRHNAEKFIESVWFSGSSHNLEIINFVEEHQGDQEWSDHVKSIYAWCLLDNGRASDAKSVNDSLMTSRNDDNDLTLDINIALQMGDWGRFPVIVDSAWKNKNDYGPDMLLRLASLAAEADLETQRAYELISLAVLKADGDPKVLMNAYFLSVQLGIENTDTVSWMNEALAKSTESGPVTAIEARVLVEEVLPAQREKISQIEDLLMKGEIPMHVASSILHYPMSRFLIDLPEKNCEQIDGRNIAVIPITSGNRASQVMDSHWVVGLDVTTIMVLYYLGQLENCIDSFNKILISPDFMLLLLNERRANRYHQPALVNSANEILGIIRSGRIKILPTPSGIPDWLMEEVGEELASLLHAAKASGGYLVHPGHINKAGAYTDVPATLREYSNHVVALNDFVTKARDQGFIDADTYDYGRRYINLIEGSAEIFSETNLSSVNVYLSELAASYLHSALVLKPVSSRGINIIVHASTATEKERLIEVSRNSDKLNHSLNEIRTKLRVGVRNGKVGFLARVRNIEDDADSYGLTALRNFVSSAGECDAVCIDDRNINKYDRVSDYNGKFVSLYTSVDVINHMASNGLITQSSLHGLQHKLRDSGFAMLGLGVDELVDYLQKAKVNERNELNESAELRAIRQLLMRIRSMGVIEPNIEMKFLHDLYSVSVKAICSFWEDEDIDIRTVKAISEWIYENTLPLLIDWFPDNNDRTSLVLQMLLLTNTSLLIRGSRAIEFSEWVDGYVLSKWLCGAEGLIADISKQYFEHIGRMCVEDLENE